MTNERPKRDRSEIPPRAPGPHLAMGAGIGVALGAGIGAALGDVAIGVGVGVALGAGLGLLVPRRKGSGS